MNLLNIGCGAQYHPAWTNIDVAPVSRDVLSWDIKQGLPFPDATFAAVYHSHVLEHLSPRHAALFLKETARVLKPAGITRVVVPDLEQIARMYLERLEAAREHAGGPSHEYEWMILELLDQMTRSGTGGEMARYLRTADRQLRSFITSRIGAEATDAWRTAEDPASTFGKLRALRAGTAWKRARNALASLLVALIAGKESLLAFREGLFRRSGEVHRWMYDRFSLARALSAAGFTDISPCAADTSRIPDFAQYHLDMIDGAVRKPDSLFLEAATPAERR